jgi:hypothetical protein
MGIFIKIPQRTIKIKENMFVQLHPAGFFAKVGDFDNSLE